MIVLRPPSFELLTKMDVIVLQVEEATKCMNEITEGKSVIYWTINQLAVHKPT